MGSRFARVARTIMRALYWNGRDLEFKSDHPAPKGGGQSALVQVSLAGICSTDLQIFKGYMNFIGVPGHEFVGRVVQGTPGLAGQRVVGEINFGCGVCGACTSGLRRHCSKRSVMGILNADGAFADCVSVPLANLHVVPNSVGDEEAVFTEPLAAAFEILEQIEVSHGDEVLVIGDGKLGNLCAQVMHLASAHVTALGKHDDKLKLLRQAGIRTMRLEKWQSQRFDIVIEATGAAAGLQLALGAVRPRGTLVLKSTIAENHQLSLAPIVIDEINVIGSRCGPFVPALEALTKKRVSVLPLIEKIYPLADGVEAAAHAAKSGTKKILLRP
jgi:threonine dehydrogenase-like Zn-dependent dehydrogenase